MYLPFGGTKALTFTPIITPVEYEIDDFEYLAALALGQNAIVTSAAQPFATFDEIIEHGRETPMTHAQQTALDEAIIRAIAAAEGLDLAILPTGGGMAPLVPGREVDFACSGGTHAQDTPTGEMVVAAFMSAERSPFHPDTPTLIELGYNCSIEGCRTIIVPRGVPDHVKERLLSAAELASTAQPFIDITEGNTFFPVVFIGQDEMEAGVRRIRAATEEVMANSPGPAKGAGAARGTGLPDGTDPAQRTGRMTRGQCPLRARPAPRQPGHPPPGPPAPRRSALT